MSLRGATRPSRGRVKGCKNPGGLLITEARHESGADHARIESYRPGDPGSQARRRGGYPLSCSRKFPLSRPIAHSCETHTRETRWGE